MYGFWEKTNERKRFDAHMKARSLAYEDCEGEQDESESMDTSGFHRRPRLTNARFRDQLMLSEWLVDIPCNLGEDWLMVPCPEGRRNLVVASDETTRAFTKSGYQIRSFPSLLPGGSRKTGSNSYCILDCVFSEVEQAFYVLDVIGWKDLPFYETETDCRFYWVQSQLTENPDILQVQRANPYPFVPLPHCECTKENIQEFMAAEDFPFKKTKLDGLLFYHRQTHYTPGRTPLVGWLKPFMLPEILDIPVPQHFMEGHEHETSKQFIDDFKDANNKKHVAAPAEAPAAKEAEENANGDGIAVN